jgi:r1t holin
MSELLTVAAPQVGWKDTLVRAAKTAVTTAVGILGTNVTGYTEINAVKAAAIAAVSAALTVVLNKVLSWAAS